MYALASDLLNKTVGYEGRFVTTGFVRRVMVLAVHDMSLPLSRAGRRGGDRVCAEMCALAPQVK